MFTKRNSKDAFMAFALSTLMVAGVSSTSASALALQDADKKAAPATIELIEEKAPRVRKNTTKVSLLKVESPELSKNKDGEGAFLSLQTPKRDGLQLDIIAKSDAMLEMERLLKASGVRGGTTRTDSILTRAGGLDLVLSDSDSKNPILTGLSLSLDSSVELKAIDNILDIPTLTPISPALTNNNDVALDREYNFGVAIGFAGVVLDANYLERDSFIEEGYRGLNVGLGYRSRNWMTRLGASEYTYDVGTNVDLLPDGVRQLYQFELGGAVRISKRMSLSAGVKVTDYGRLLRQEENTWGQSFYLGGRFSY